MQAEWPGDDVFETTGFLYQYRVCCGFATFVCGKLIVMVTFLRLLVDVKYRTFNYAIQLQCLLNLENVCRIVIHV